MSHNSAASAQMIKKLYFYQNNIALFAPQEESIPFFVVFQKAC
jgi:hypothetical protein